MKYLVTASACLILVLLIICIQYDKRIRNIEKLEKEMGFNFPINAKLINFEKVNYNSDQQNPYSLYVKVQMTENEYLQTVGNILINRNDCNNPIYKKTLGSIHNNPNLFWGFHSYASEVTFPSWWNLSPQMKPKYLFANLLTVNSDTKHFGEIATYNGKVVSYFDGKNSYFFLECYYIPNGANMQ